MYVCPSLTKTLIRASNNTRHHTNTFRILSIFNTKPKKSILFPVWVYYRKITYKLYNKRDNYIHLLRRFQRRGQPW